VQSKTPTANAYFSNNSSVWDKNNKEKTNKSSTNKNKIHNIDACLDEIIKLSAKLFNNMRLRSLSVSNDNLEAYLDEARRTQISYSYIVQDDDDDSATLMINEYETLLSKYKEQKNTLIQSSRLKSARDKTLRSTVSIESDNDEKILIEELENSLNIAENMIRQSIADSY
jgi:hypothetical protein